MNIEQLDELINYLFSKKEQYSTYTEIKKRFSEYDVEGLLIKLDKDGFIDSGSISRIRRSISGKETNALGQSEEGIYKLSFEGIMFKLSGGYNQKLRIDYLNAKNLEIDVRIRRRNEKITAIGSLVAGLTGSILVSWEIIKMAYK